MWDNWLAKVDHKRADVCRPCCGGAVDRVWSSSSSDDDRDCRTDYPGETVAPFPAALRYGKGLETRPIFTRTVCHSHASHRTRLTMTRFLLSSATIRVVVGQLWEPDLTKIRHSPKKSTAEALHQHSCKGAAILGSTHNALFARACHDTSLLFFLCYKQWNIINSFTPVDNESISIV
ncbi:uncharacterized protein LOC144077187 [Stigmatopora argus]